MMPHRAVRTSLLMTTIVASQTRHPAFVIRHSYLPQFSQKPVPVGQILRLIFLDLREQQVKSLSRTQD